MAKYRIRDNRLLWNWNHSNNDSFFVKVVRSLLKLNSPSLSLIEKGFNIVIGKEDRAEFWTEIKWVSRTLRDTFPKVYALAVRKRGSIQEFGSWSSSEWVWNVQTRRSLFDWE